MAENEAQSDVEEEALSQVDLLRCVQRNMLMDAGFSAMGYQLLGLAISGAPELNKPELFDSTLIGPEHNTSWTEFNVNTVPVGLVKVVELVSDMDIVVSAIQRQLDVTLQHCTAKGKRIVAGSLRVHIQLEGPVVSISLLWIERNKGEEHDGRDTGSDTGNTSDEGSAKETTNDGGSAASAD